jgi:hypothetical protein
MATRRSTLGLKTEEQQLQQSRSIFIQTLEKKRQFEADCVVIIPELDDQWKTKILPLLGYNPAAIASWVPTVFGDAASFGYNPEHVINWRHYLYNYSPQLLQKAITQLASRLKEDHAGSPLVGKHAPILNPNAYYKSLVQNLRRAEIARSK